MTAPVACRHLAGIAAKLGELTAAGAPVEESVRAVGGGRLMAAVGDPDGYVVGLFRDWDGKEVVDG
jgi:hypothetical protein